MSLETMRANLPVGSVNQVIDRLLEEISILKPSHIALQTQLGDFDQTTMLRQIEVWGERSFRRSGASSCVGSRAADNVADSRRPQDLPRRILKMPVAGIVTAGRLSVQQQSQRE